MSILSGGAPVSAVYLLAGILIALVLGALLLFVLGLLLLFVLGVVLTALFTLVGHGNHLPCIS